MGTATTIDLGGRVRIRFGETSSPLRGRTAVLVAYLAIERMCPRARAAALLWPDASDRAARTNLRQLLHQLRKRVGAVVIEDGDPLTLAAEVKLEWGPESPDGGDTTGELLASEDLSLLPELDDWLAATRTRLGLKARVLREQEVERLVAAGALDDAAVLLERLLADSPTAEDLHRRLIELLYLRGDRGAALHACARCREVLKRELDVDPMPETLALERAIRSAPKVPATGRSPVRRPLPIEVARPPVLAGREREWQLLEQAWEKGKFIVLRGPPGVGKTRLLRDFFESKGPHVVMMARPGDRTIPFATHARHAREHLRLFPDLWERVEPWVRRELERLLPDRAKEPGAAMRPLLEEDKLRVYEAIGEFAAHVSQGLVGIGTDDMQYMDPYSFEAAMYLSARYFPIAPGVPHPAIVYRSGSLAIHFEEMLTQLIDQGVCAVIDVEPLSVEGVHELLKGASIPHAGELSEQLARLTGGYPLFIVEALKSLSEQGELDPGGLRRLFDPQSGNDIISRRLRRLAPIPLRLLRAAAVVDEGFDLELAGALLGIDAYDLAGPWQELEDAQLLEGGDFLHDLVRETVRATTPRSLRELLHMHYARILEASGANQALVSHHREQAAL